MKDQNSQGVSQNGEQKYEEQELSVVVEGPGGFMAGTHKMHQTNYGPDSPLPSEAKVFAMIQHHLIGNWQIRMAISLSVIEQQTGVNKRTAIRVIQKLAKNKMLLVEKRKIGGVKQENIYQLHPFRFGNNPLYQGDELKRPTFQIISGGKFVPKIVGGGDKSGSTLSVKSNTTPSDNRDTTKRPKTLAQSGSCPTTRTENQESIKNNTGIAVESNGIEWEQVKLKLLKDYPLDIDRLEYAYGQISTTKVFKNIEVFRPAGYILKSWYFMRADYAFVDDIQQAKNKTTDMGPRETASPEVVARAMAGFRKMRP